MNIFSVKSVILYSLAIGSAIGFFQIVTSYGEANIKAPISVTGNYLITAEKLPSCLQGKQLLLKLQQSGIYLNASIVNEATAKDNRPTFSGRLNHRQLNLIGILPTNICAQLSQLKIAGSLVEHFPAKIIKSNSSGAVAVVNKHPQELQGQFQVASKNSSYTTPFEFTAIIQPSTQRSQSH